MFNHKTQEKPAFFFGGTGKQIILNIWKSRYMWVIFYNFSYDSLIRKTRD